MSGILDNKSRVIDAILTQEGRRQMAEGTFSVNYATFTDAHVVYEVDQKEGHTDPTKKMYLEAFNAPQDQITFEADDSGLLSPFSGGQLLSIGQNNFRISQGKLKESTVNFISGTFSESIVSGSRFAASIEGILTSSVDNFQKLQILSTIDRLFNDDQFAISPNEVEFKIVPNQETIQMLEPTPDVFIDSLFNDEKLRNLINFKWLPPIKKVGLDEFIDKTDSLALADRGYSLGNYPPWGKIGKLTFERINKELKNYEENSKVVYFDPTSRDNDIVAQFFEITENEVRKLDVIDYGRVYNNSQSTKVATHHVFFVGKLITNEVGADCFIHLFTLIFGSSEEEF